MEQADELMVLLGDKRKFPAKLIGTDPKTDLAVIKIDATGLATLPWGDSITLEVGELVLAVGNPFGLNQTVTMGIISAVGRANVGIVDYENFIQTDAAINPGNSGGALVNLQGQLIGINTAIFSRTGGYMGIGFAIPSQMVKPIPILATLPWGDSINLEVGELVLAVGNPFGLNQTVTMGIISAVGRANVGIVDYENFIQTDAAINPGNSGGALVNLQGQLIGINTAIFSRTGGYMGIGFAIPSQMVKHVMQSLIGQGKVIRGWLGVSIQELSQDLAKQFDAPDTQGALVGDVFSASPAGLAGLQRGDIIRTYNEVQVKNPTHLRSLVADTVPDTSVPLTVLRNSKEVSLSVSIGEMPKDVASLAKAGPDSIQGDHALAGLSVEPVKRGQTAEGNGVAVTQVEPNSPAARAGIRPGDILVEVNRQSIHSVEDFEQLASSLDAKASVLVLVQRGKGTVFLTIKPS